MCKVILILYSFFLKYEGESLFSEICIYTYQNVNIYLEICIFCVLQYIDFQKQSVNDALKVLTKFSQTVLDETNLLVNRYCPPTSSPRDKQFLSAVSNLPYS